MYNLVTLVLILHNRHSNLDRLLDYYRNCKFPILIADSSHEKHAFENENHQYKHLYTPGVSFTKKIELVLAEVTTLYVVMCADDDFIIPDAIIECVAFLEKNKTYSIAQGTCLKYNKESISKKEVEFDLLYEVRAYDIEADDPLGRLEKMFEVYRSVLYAVHRTQVLKTAFDGASGVIQNLYLNEYLTAVLPIVFGKYKELSILYQVREFAEDSDDKVTDNLDAIFLKEKYGAEREAFINLLTKQIKPLTNASEDVIRTKLIDVLTKFSSSSQIGKPTQVLTLKKRVGLFIKKLPILGEWLIQKNRKAERANNLKQVIKTPKERSELIDIEKILKKYAN